MADSGRNSGVGRAAILLRALGEEHASKILKHLGVSEVQAVSRAMVELESISSEQVGAVLGEFVERVGEQTAFSIDSDAYVRKMLEKALGPAQATGLLDRVLGGSNHDFAELKWMNAEAIADMLNSEHPQIVAIVLASLEPSLAGQTLGHLPEALRTDALARVARLESIRPTALEQLRKSLLMRLSGNSSARLAKSKLNGAKVAAGILNELEPTLQRDLQEGIRALDADLGEQVEELMFVFENLVELDDRSMQALLREVESELLVTALRGSSEKLKRKIFSNMSRRAAELLQDDLETMAPVKLSDVEAAQKEIITVARRLAEEGSIMLRGSGGDAYV